MVTTLNVSQLSAESNTWRMKMRQYREELVHLKQLLRQLALKAAGRDQLQDLEHYENQFYIQLINIHDLKHSIKVHDYKTSLTTSQQNRSLNHTVLAEHQYLHAEYQRLQSILEDLKSRFTQFVRKFN